MYIKHIKCINSLVREARENLTFKEKCGSLDKNNIRNITYYLLSPWLIEFICYCY